MKSVSFSDLYGLCNKESFFTNGSNEQYDKMFELASGGTTQRELALILYICSSQSYDYIYNALSFLFE